MAQFQVPQFIDTEDKIIGPFSMKQFAALAIAGAVVGLLFFILTFWLWIIVTVFVMAIAFSFALVKINGRGLGPLTLSALNYYSHPQSYVFKLHGKTRGAPLKVQPGGLKSIFQKLATSETAVPKRELALPPLSLKNPPKVDEHYELIRRVSADKEAARRVDYR